MVTRIATIVSLLGALSACGTPSSGPGERSRDPVATPASGGGSIWDLLEEGRRRKAEHQSKVVSSGRQADLPPQAASLVAAWFEAYRRQAPEVQVYREQIEDLGPIGPQIMVDNLIRYGVAALHSGAGPEVARTVKELDRYFDHAAFTLVEGLAAGHGDSVARNHCGSLLAGLGERALPVIAEGFERAAGGGDGATLATSPRRDLARVVRLMETPSALPLLVAMAGSGESVPVRLEALSGLGPLRSPGSLPSFVAALRDPDRSVRKFAARHCREVGIPDRSLLESLVDCLEDAYGRGESDVGGECATSLERLLGKGRREPSAWRALVEGRG